MTTLPRPTRFRAAVVFAALAAAASASPASAQFSGGIKAGVGQLSYTGQGEFNWRVSGPNSTAFINWAGAGKLSQQLEVGESRRLGVSTTGGSTLTFSATYIDMLLLTKLTFGKTFGTRPFLLAGPTLSYSASCNTEFPIVGLGTSKTPCDSTAGTSRLDFGIAVAGGLSWAVGKSTVSVEARAGSGFRSVVVPLPSPSARSLAWSVLAGVSVPFRFNVGRGRQPTGVPTMPGVATLESIGAGVITESHPATPPELLGPTGAGASTKKISVTAVDADARSLLIAIAREAGISLVVSNDVRRRVSVSFKDASPEEAIRAIIADAGLTIVEPPSARAMPSVVFYQLPVNVNEAPAEAIAARFGVSSDLAKYLVETRPPAAPARPEKLP